ncbi:MAG: adenylate/guanylate cyclase domain-containing protein [Bacteroidota bacterium]
MTFLITRKFKRNVLRIIPFGMIWLFTGWMFLLSEALYEGGQVINSETEIKLTLPVFLFASVCIFLLGVLVGIIETRTLQKYFLRYTFLKKIILKFIIYLLMLISAICLTYPTAVFIEMEFVYDGTKIWGQTGQFLLSSMFLNTLLQLSFSLFLCLLYSAVSENLGYSVLLNFFTGKYHKPVVERRIFMFLDMKDSTSIAESLGHDQYFRLLFDYYNLMSVPIIDHMGEVYQYIGDEVVVTWEADQGLKENNCINCFFEIKRNLAIKKAYFMDRYGVVPDFKAGIHIGEATVGEIGALKKEIVFVGDVLNTTARIQGMCNDHDTDLIISDDLKLVMRNDGLFLFERLGDIPLKGKAGSKLLYSVRL